jgi:hypothetical protein
VAVGGILYAERFMHHFWGNILVPQCVVFEGTVRTGPQPSQNSFGSKLGLMMSYRALVKTVQFPINSAGLEEVVEPRTTPNDVEE